MLKIAVVVPGQLESPGEFLADARALETAGAEALWLDSGDDDRWDPWMLAAAVATVTSRVGLGLTPGDLAPTLAPRVRTLQRFSRGRAVLQGDARGLESVVELARDAGGCRVFGQAADDRDWRRDWPRIAAVADGLRLGGTTPENDHVRVERVAALAAGGSRATPFEVWIDLEVPEDRAAWRRILAAYATTGATGLVLPLDPRLLDLLRRSDEEDDRSDLGLAQG